MFQTQRVGIGSGRDLLTVCFRNIAGEAIGRYTYFSNLVGRMRLPSCKCSRLFIAGIHGPNQYIHVQFIIHS